MAPRICCCDGPCLIAEDDFNRADSNPPSGNWLVVDGEWEIDTNRLRSISEGPIVTTIKQDASTRPNTEYSIRVYFKALNIGIGSSFGVICGYVDEDNFAWVRFDRVGNSVLPKFYMRSGGSDTLVMDITTHPGGVGFPIDTSGGLNTWQGKICYSNTDWTVDGDTSQENGGIQNVGTEHPWTVGDQGGQSSLPSVGGMVGFLYGEFDDWYFHKHWEAKVTCDYCSCLCRNPLDDDDYIALPEVMLCTFVPQFDPLDYPCSLNGATIVIYQVEIEGETELSPVKRVWANENIVEGTGTPSDAEIVLRCNSSTGISEERFTLSLKIPSATGTYDFGQTGFTVGGIPAAYVEWDVSTCDPLSLVFGELQANTVATCETIPGGGGEQGYKMPLCVGDGCRAPQTDEIRDQILALRWKIVVTEL